MENQARQMLVRLYAEPVWRRRFEESGPEGLEALAREMGFTVTLAELERALGEIENPSEPMGDDELERVAGGISLAFGGLSDRQAKPRVPAEVRRDLYQRAVDALRQNPPPQSDAPLWVQRLRSQG